MWAVSPENTMFNVIGSKKEAADIVTYPAEKIDDVKYRTANVELNNAVNDKNIIDVYPESFFLIISLKCFRIEVVQRLRKLKGTSKN